MYRDCINGLADFPAIRKDIANAGVRHLRYGAKAEHYPIVGDTLLWTLEDMLGLRFTAEVDAAWKSVYGELATVMLEAAAAANDDKH